MTTELKHEGAWTHGNTSRRYEAIVDDVFRTITAGGGHILDEHWARMTARQIVSRMAYVHGLAPTPEGEER